MNNTAIWVLMGFLSGGLPLAFWLGKLALRVDIRSYGDGNPGATNVIRAGGWRWGFLAMLLEAFKGALPVGLAYFVAGIGGLDLVLIALAPVVGHMFSPFLGWRGGKAVAVTFGIWVGLSIWEVPTILGLMLGYWFAVVRTSGWAVMLAIGSIAAYLLLTDAPSEWLAIALGNALLLALAHRQELRHLPDLRAWFLPQQSQQTQQGSST